MIDYHDCYCDMIGQIHLIFFSHSLLPVIDILIQCNDFCATIIFLKSIIQKLQELLVL